jgi:hypothetical protein
VIENGALLGLLPFKIDVRESIENIFFSTLLADVALSQNGSRKEKPEEALPIP